MTLTQRTDTTTARSAWRMPAAMIAAGTLAFAALAADVVFRGRLAQCDDSINAWLHQHSDPWGVLLFSAISMLGDLRVLSALGLAVALYLIARRRWPELAIWLSALTGSALLDAALKLIFRIPRPTAHSFFVFDPNPGYSFPSGHAMAVTITAGALLLVTQRLRPMRRARRWTLTALVAAFGLLESFALIYMGVHYLTDVLAGLSVALAWLGILRLIPPPAPAHYSLGTSPSLR